MNEFLTALDRALHGLGKEERDDILADYREHFEIGISQGKTESQIMRELGDPDSIAKLYTALNATSKAEKSRNLSDAFHVVGAALAYRLGGGLTVGTVYLTFVLFMIVAFALGVGLILGAAGAILLAPLEIAKGFMEYGVLAIFLGITLLSLGALTLIGSKALWKITMAALPKLARRLMGRGKEKEE
jgi:uncharacterized membrane protein